MPLVAKMVIVITTIANAPTTTNIDNIYYIIYLYSRILIFFNYSFNLFLIIYILYIYGLYTNHIKFISNRIKHDCIIHHHTYHWSAW
jgi:hypothetical protein